MALKRSEIKEGARVLGLWESDGYGVISQVLPGDLRTVLITWDSGYQEEVSVLDLELTEED